MIHFFTGSKIKDELEKTIAYNQAPFAKIEVYSEGIATATLVPPAGNYDDKYKEGDLINLRFEPQENFNFVKWIASPDDSVLFDTPEELSTSAKILSSEYPISIHPVVVNKDILTVNYAYERESVYSSASSKLFKGTEFQIRYNEDPDYAFVKWVVLDIDNTEVTDILELNETELQTDVKILKTGTVVTLKAVVLERPSVVSATPVYSTNGVFRDNRIIVMFDKPIDPSSIYYSEEELRKLGIISSTETITETINSAEGWTLLKDSMRNNACYGYQKTDDDNLTVFKNIIISKRENSNVSLLKYYNPPYFESKDSSILRIDPKSNNDAPPGATDIIVTIKKDFGFYDNQKLITLPTNYKWTYYTNSNIDNLAPIFIDTGSLKFNVQFAEKDQENFITPNTGVHKFATETTDEFMENTSTVASNFIKNRLRTKKLWVSGQFEDGGSGPNYLKWELFKVNSYYYPVNTEEFIEKGQIDDIAIEGFKARITKKANIADDVSGTSIEFNSPLHEGLYRIDFIIADKNERTSKKSYYFVYDEEVQVNDESLKITNERKTVDKEKISWDIDELLDYSGVQIQQFFNGTEITGKNEHASEYSFSNMSQGRYTYKLWVKDIYGNISSEPIIWEDRIPPANITSHRAGVKYKKIYFYADAPNDADVAGIKFTKDNISESIAAKPYNRISKFYTYDTVNPDETTVVSVVAYDYAGNESVEPYVFVEHNGIAKGDICYKDETGNILFTKPENFINQYYDVEYNDYCAKEYLFYSMSYPLGYVCDVPEDYSKIRILEMISHDVSNTPWGKMQILFGTKQTVPMDYQITIISIPIIKAIHLIM